MITEERINYAYDALAAALRCVRAREQEQIQAKYELECALGHALRSGVIEGKNQQIRDSIARDLLAEQYAQVRAAEFEASEARLQLDLARAGVSRVQALLRLAELVKEREA
jgi:hypothetical protein